MRYALSNIQISKLGDQIGAGWVERITLKQHVPFCFNHEHYSVMMP